MFPDKNKYLKMPKLLNDQKRLEDFMGLKYEDGKAHDHKFAEFMQVYDVSKLQDAIYKDLDHKHITDSSRSKLQDIEKQMEFLKEKAIKSGNAGVPRREIEKIIRQVKDEYANPMAKDSHGQLHAAFAKETLDKWESVEADYEAQMAQIDIDLDSDEEIKEYKSKIAEKLSQYDTDNFKIADFMEKEFPVDEESESEEVFEEKSKFDQNEGQGKWVGIMQKVSENQDKFRFDEELDDENKIEITEAGFGSK